MPDPNAAAPPVPPLAAEGVRAVPLASGAPAPRRLDLVRLHAFGDTALVLPVLGGLAARYPECRIEIVTGPASADLFRARSDVAAVHVLDARAGRLARRLAAWRLARALRRDPPDAIVDLQRSRLTRALLLLSRPRAWAAFDRFAPRPALDRYLDALAACGVPAAPDFAPRTRPETVARALSLLDAAGRDVARPLVLLNPAGGWKTKRWPLERWIALGRALAAERRAQLLLLGAGDAAARAAALARALGADALDLVGRTSPSEAMAAAAACALAVSEDSGLMHLASCQGVPTLALFGSSRATWSRPAGPRSDGFYSEDLACGACMRPECARGDLLCLARVSVEEAAARAWALLP